MIFGRMLLSLSLHRSSNVSLQKLNVVKIWKLHSSFTNSFIKVETFQPKVQRFRSEVTGQTWVCLPAVSVMQPASSCFGGEANTVSSDGEDDDEEGYSGGADTLVEVKSEMQQDKKMPTDLVDVMEVHRSKADAETPAVFKSNEKKSKRKIRREKMKLIKKKLKSVEASASLMSELPFALTSPTTWKELGFPTLETAEKKRKRKRGDSGVRLDSEEDVDQKKKKKSQRPNYFVSIPITNPQIKSLVKEVQEGIIQQEPRLAKAMIPVPTLHITLLVTHLASQEQVELYCTGIKRVEPDLYSDYKNKFFGNQTVERLDLCSMLKKKQPDGYYHTDTSLQLGKHADNSSVETK
ncbi:PREDICTED: A-kinase anchor protein 7 isoform gamma-like [Cyprinodon variegatus]|uniref:A-kinase anchor protein 7 isoform gamma-like n=1 Tax=Cyprinodon variegatus TaxID=28743 RepID=UPI0007427348|nr:PREDICTED: A-kinase anchor protein 7 isoform gamma-like [Cyprinodon variegatus]